MGERGPIPKDTRQLRRRNKKSWIDDANGISRPPAGAKAAKPDEPPRSGKGSGTDVWRAYAEGLGLSVPDGAKRSDIFALVDEGLPRDVDEGWHPLARDWYRSLGESGQSVYYEPSDWQTARVLAELLSKALRAGRVTAALIERWQSGATELLTTEGARRRAQIELQRPTEDEGDEPDGSAQVTDIRSWREGLNG